jgi:hypothetical protein
MAQQLLDDAQVGTVLEEMRRESMAQDVRGQRRGPQPGGPGQPLEIARENLQRRGLSRARVSLAEHRALPLPGGCADLVLAAWALDSVVNGGDETGWRLAVDEVVQEMSRIATRDGVVLIVASPHGARDLGGYLERAHGFERRLFKAVWRFPSRRVARAATRLFFGSAAWKGYRLHWPKLLVTLGGIWWRTCIAHQ